MISISEGLLPDLNANAPEKPAPLISFSYDNTLEEIDGAMKTFQAHFSSKKGLLTIIAYSILLVAIIVLIILNPTAIVVYVALVLCLFGLIYSATDKSRRRKKTIEALKDMNPEDYNAYFYPDRIEIETIIMPKANEVDVEIDENSDTENLAPIKNVFRFGDDLLNYRENRDSVLLIFNRRQIFCFPKRCLEKEQLSQLRLYLEDKIGQ